jgi:sirohydrochlorin ferrochelatase
MNAANTELAPPAAAEGGAHDRGQSGHPGVAAAIELLGSLDGRPLGEHPDVYAAIHERLSEALASVDDA